MRSTLSSVTRKNSPPQIVPSSPVAGAVPRNAERGRRDFIFRHARQNMRDVVLDADVVWSEFKLQLVGRFRFSGTLKRELQRDAAEFARKLRREIIRVQIGGDDFRLGVVKFFKIGDDAAEGGMRLLRFQIADVLADENLVADGQRDGIFQMRANGQNNFGSDFDELGGFRTICSSCIAIEWAAAHSRAPGAKPFRGPASRARSNRPRAGRWGGCGREKHRRCRQPFQRLVFVRANRLVAQIAAGGDDGKTEFGHQQMMQRSVRQHHAEIGIAGSDITAI